MSKLIFEFKNQDELDRWYGSYLDGGGESEMYENFSQNGEEYPQITIIEEKADTVTLPRSEYNDLVEDRQWLHSLEAAGVDNWEGYDVAQDMHNEGKE